MKNKSARSFWYNKLRNTASAILLGIMFYLANLECQQSTAQEKRAERQPALPAPRAQHCFPLINIVFIIHTTSTSFCSPINHQTRLALDCFWKWFSWKFFLRGTRMKPRGGLFLPPESAKSNHYSIPLKDDWLMAVVRFEAPRNRGWRTHGCHSLIIPTEPRGPWRVRRVRWMSRGIFGNEGSLIYRMMIRELRYTVAGFGDWWVVCRWKRQ